MSKKRQKSKRVNHQVWAILFGLLAIVQSVYAIEGDPELIPLVLNARKENMERISTWRGNATLEKTRAFENGMSEIDSIEEVDFAFDQNLDAVRWNLIVHERAYASGGPSVSPDKPENHDGLLRGDQFFRHEPGLITPEGEKHNTLVILPREKQKIQGFAHDFHPMWYFTPGGGKVDAFLSSYYENKDNSGSKDKKTSITREGDLVIWELGRGDRVKRYVFDLSKGGNIKESISSSPRAESQYAWSYEQIDGVWVPVEFEFNSLQKYPNGDSRQISRKVSFSDNEINIPLADDEFTLDRLGVVHGTQVSDNILGIAYRYGEAEVNLVGEKAYESDSFDLLAKRGDGDKVSDETPAPSASDEPLQIPDPTPPVSSHSFPTIIPIAAIMTVTIFIGYRVTRRK
jgi:hypothetical protein